MSAASTSSQVLISNSGGEEKERPRLTDSEKKANHIASGEFTSSTTKQHCIAVEKVEFLG
jgi:hypothetical protein